MARKDNNSLTLGVDHVALTVLDLDATVRFFVGVLGYDKVGEDPGYPAAFVSDGATMLALWRARDPQTATAFDRMNVLGLHHLALRVAPDELDALHDMLRSVDSCEIEFGPEPFHGGPSRHMMTTIPGSGIRVEFRALG